METLLYETDFFAWTKRQAMALAQQDFAQLDIANLVEEIEDMGKSQQRQLESRLSILIGHLLKWQFQPARRSRSWQLTIRTQRRHLQKLLEQNPSLRARLAFFVAEAYADAVDLAWAETGLEFDDFPSSCPYTAEQILYEQVT